MEAPTGITPFGLLVFQFQSLLHIHIYFNYKNRISKYNKGKINGYVTSYSKISLKNSLRFCICRRTLDMETLSGYVYNFLQLREILSISYICIC